MRVNVVMVAYLALAVIGVGQTNSGPAKPAVTVRSGQMGGVATAGFAVGVPVIGNIIPGHLPASPIGRPYSAEQLTEHVQTLADGTHIAQTVSKFTSTAIPKVGPEQSTASCCLPGRRAPLPRS